jgi:allophanate hydrolase subunit 2
VTPAADHRLSLPRWRASFVEREQPFGAGSDPSNVVDVGYPVGSIQVPGGVEPICLLNDAVTGGGYVTIGTVISVDRDVLAQSKTHGKTHFRAVGIEEALQARAERRARLDAVRAALS